MSDGLPIWATAQLCVVLYVVGVTLPYLFTYMSPKKYRLCIDTAIQNYNERRRYKDAQQLQQEQRRLATLKNTVILSKRHVQYQKQAPSTSSSESESESESVSDTSSSSEETGQEETNNNSVIEGLDSIIDLFDTEIVPYHDNKRDYTKPGRAFRI